jgi:hypothetical protein
VLNIVISIFGLLTDLVVLLLPVPVVLGLRMSIKRRCGSPIFIYSVTRT